MALLGWAHVAMIHAMTTPRLKVLCGLTAMLAAVGCGGGGSEANPLPTVLRFDKSITVDARQRTYTVVMPPQASATAAVPIVIALHGGGGTAAQFESTSLLTSKANAAGFAVVYPNGTAGVGGLQTWNAGGCCGGAVASNVDDVNFMRQMVADVVANHMVDAKRVYATGHSNGGMLAYRLACDWAGGIAAIAPNAAALVTSPCTPTRPVPVLHMHSKLDLNVPIAGGVGVGPSGVPYPTLASATTHWVAANACGPTPQVVVDAGRLTRTTWASCSAGATVQTIVTEDGGHAWPGGLPGSSMGDTPSTSLDANDTLLAFFRPFVLP